MNKKVGLEDLKPGSRYKVSEHLGHGSYGYVAKALDQKTNQNVAVKRMHKVEDQVDAKRMLREIKILRNFKHDNVLNLQNVEYVHNENEDFGDVYLITPLYEIDLNKVIKSRQELTDEHIQWIMYQIFRGLKFLHSGNIVHRDIKPSNILATESCEIAICDFGFAREVKFEQEALTEYVVTRFYRAPEIMLSSHHQIVWMKQYKQAVDIWSVGCTFYELLTGTPLFTAKNYLELIQMIIDKLGKPTKDEISFVKNTHARNFLEKLKDAPRRKVSTDLKHSNKMALDLLDKLVIFNPANRLTSEEALAHPYFTGVHDPKDEPEFKGTVEFSFEYDEKISLIDLKLMIIDEVNSIKKDLKEEQIDREKMKKFFEKRSVKKT